ncbi:LOW QUALITY PROTEIN: afadin- and alpha-actinin-binding protein [Osmerus eperlanus]|uniref:LOW QUALITY PROTEIN: afadin- and alpha-actinin-binding protein n=1 Tax=Osmerus eperlanus TaxID=29151 RepID=UPI002E139E87
MSKRGQRRPGALRRGQEFSDLQDTFLLSREPGSSFSETSHSTSWWAGRDERKVRGPSLKEQLSEKEQHIARIQDALRREREKSSRLQSRCVQQGAELRRREQQASRLRERLADTRRDRGHGEGMHTHTHTLASVMLIEQLLRPARGNPSRREEAALPAMLERREAELREAMKLRHGLTSLLHTLRRDMEQTIQDTDVEQEEADNGVGSNQRRCWGSMWTGGVVQGWRKVQRRLEDLLIAGHTGEGTDQDKLLAQLEQELQEGHQLIKTQQQLLQDSLNSPMPDTLEDCYFLEEWEGLQARRAEMEQQRRSFQRERQAFTDAAIRLGRERCEFEQQKASLVKQHYLCESPVFGKTTRYNRRESTALSLLGSDHTSFSDSCLAASSSLGSGVTPWPRWGTARGCGEVRVQTPSTPELYSFLRLPFQNRSSENPAQPESWDKGARRHQLSPLPPGMDFSF